MNMAVQQREPLVTISGVVEGKVAAESARQPGKVKLSTGQMLQAFPEKLQQIQVGQAYDFGCAPSEFKGVIRNTIRTLKPSGNVGPAPANFITREEIEAQRHPNAPAEPRGNYSVVHTHPQRQDAKPAQQTEQYYRPTAPRDAERMFVCATLGHFIDRGTVAADTDELVNAINVLRSAWQATFGADDQ